MLGYYILGIGYKESDDAKIHPYEVGFDPTDLISPILLDEGRGWAAVGGRFKPSELLQRDSRFKHADLAGCSWIMPLCEQTAADGGLDVTTIIEAYQQHHNELPEWKTLMTAPAHNVIQRHPFLADMYRSDFFPDVMVHKCKRILIDLCEAIETTEIEADADLFELTHAAIERINGIHEEFEKHGSEIETAAREALCEEFEFVVRTYGFTDVDIEDVTAPRDW